MEISGKVEAKESAREHATIEEIKKYADLIKDSWSLCDFYGNCEAEVMVAQTIHAAVLNHKTHGETFSFLGANARSNSLGKHRNGDALNRLLTEGMFDMGTFGDADVLYPTKALIRKLEAYFSAKGRKR